MKFLAALLLLILAGMSPAGAQSVTCLHQRASATVQTCSTFDFADGTLIDGNLTDDGHSRWVEAAHTVVVINGELNNTGNSYAGYSNTLTPGGVAYPLVHFGGEFRYNRDTNNMATTLIGDSGTGTFLSKMVHLNFGLHNAFLTVAAPGYPFPTVIGSFTYDALTVGAIYSISMDVDAASNKVIVHTPDGKVATIVHPAVGLVNPTFAAYQLGGFSTAGDASWISAWSGEQKSKAFVAAGGGAPMADVTFLKGLENRRVGTKNIGTSGSFAFATFTTGSSQFDNTLSVKVRASAVSSALPGVAMDVGEYEVPIISNASINLIGPGGVALVRANPQASFGIALAGTVTASISGQIVTLYYNPAVSGSNAWYVTGERLNWVVEAQGDPNGLITPQ